LLAEMVTKGIIEQRNQQKMSAMFSDEKAVLLQKYIAEVTEAIEKMSLEEKENLKEKCLKIELNHKVLLGKYDEKQITELIFRKLDEKADSLNEKEKLQFIVGKLDYLLSNLVKTEKK